MHKVPTGAKHARCFDHIPHAYPSSGWLCIGTSEPDRPAMMREFADHLTEVAARHRAQERPLPDASTNPLYCTDALGEVNGVPTVCRGHCGFGTGETIHVHPRGERHLGGPNIVEVDTYVAAVARKRARKPASVAPVETPRYIESDPHPLPDPVAPVDALGARRTIVPVELVPCPYVRLNDACTAGLQGHKGPCEFPPAAHCTSWLHRSSGPVKCTIGPDGHAGEHEYPPVVAVEPAPASVPAAPFDWAAYDRMKTDWAATHEPVHKPRHGRRAHVRRHVARPAQPAPAAPVLTIVAPTGRPACPRCGQTFRKSGVGLTWHVANRPDCAARLSASA